MILFNLQSSCLYYFEIIQKASIYCSDKIQSFPAIKVEIYYHKQKAYTAVENEIKTSKALKFKIKSLVLAGNSPIIEHIHKIETKRRGECSILEHIKSLKIVKFLNYLGIYGSRWALFSNFITYKGLNAPICDWFWNSLMINPIERT